MNAAPIGTLQAGATPSGNLARSEESDLEPRASRPVVMARLFAIFCDAPVNSGMH